MNIDLHVHRFGWAGGPADIAPGIEDLAQRAEAVGVRTLSFMDHYFQMDRFAPAEDPMLEGFSPRSSQHWMCSLGIATAAAGPSP